MSSVYVRPYDDNMLTSLVFQAAPLKLTTKMKNICYKMKLRLKIRTVTYIHIHIYTFIHLFIISKTGKNVELSLKGKR